VSSRFGDHLHVRARDRGITIGKLVEELLLRADKSVEIPEDLIVRVDRMATRMNKGREEMLALLLRQGLDRLERR
jgi:hypothetical protein